MKKFLKRTLLMLISVLLISVAFVLYQSIFYVIEGGVFVADKYEDPPLSGRIYHKNRMSVGEAATTPRTDGKGFNMGLQYKLAYWNAFRKFSTLAHCLKPNARKRLDLSGFDWKRLRTHTQVEVCMYHVGHHLREPSEHAKWLETQGFEVRFNDKQPDFKQEAHNFPYSINAEWSRKKNGTASPYPLISWQTFAQYSPFFILLGKKPGKVKFTISFNVAKKIEAFKIRTAPII